MTPVALLTLFPGIAVLLAYMHHTQERSGPNTFLREKTSRAVLVGIIITYLFSLIVNYLYPGALDVSSIIHKTSSNFFWMAWFDCIYIQFIIIPLAISCYQIVVYIKKAKDK